MHPNCAERKKSKISCVCVSPCLCLCDEWPRVCIAICDCDNKAHRQKQKKEVRLIHDEQRQKAKDNKLIAELVYALHYSFANIDV